MAGQRPQGLVALPREALEVAGQRPPSPCPRRCWRTLVPRRRVMTKEGFLHPELKVPTTVARTSSRQGVTDLLGRRQQKEPRPHPAGPPPWKDGRLRTNAVGPPACRAQPPLSAPHGRPSPPSWPPSQVRRQLVPVPLRQGLPVPMKTHQPLLQDGTMRCWSRP